MELFPLICDEKSINLVCLKGKYENFFLVEYNTLYLFLQVRERLSNINNIDIILNETRGNKTIAEALQKSAELASTHAAEIRCVLVYLCDRNLMKLDLWFFVSAFR